MSKSQNKPKSEHTFDVLNYGFVYNFGFKKKSEI